MRKSILRPSKTPDGPDTCEVQPEPSPGEVVEFLTEKVRFLEDDRIVLMEEIRLLRADLKTAQKETSSAEARLNMMKNRCATLKAKLTNAGIEQEEQSEHFFGDPIKPGDRTKPMLFNQQRVRRKARHLNRRNP